MSRPGIKVTRIDNDDPNTAEILLEPAQELEEATAEELHAAFVAKVNANLDAGLELELETPEGIEDLLHELTKELTRLRGSNTSLRTAKETLFQESKRLRTDLNAARAEIRTLQIDRHIASLGLLPKTPDLTEEK